jgi:group I intron endonuclease
MERPTMKTMGVYGVRNTQNNKWYVGQSKDCWDRWCGHRNQLRHGTHENKHWQASWNKYGETAFVFCVLTVTTEEERDAVERSWIRKQRSNDRRFGYNKEDGGCLGKHLSEETKRKLSLWHTGYVYSVEARRNMSLSRLGSHRSLETRRRISEAGKGRSPSIETRLKLSAINCGKRLSEETRRKIASSNMGKTRSIWAIRKQWWKVIVVPKTPEHRAALRRGWLLRNARRVFADDYEVTIRPPEHCAAMRRGWMFRKAQRLFAS